MALSAEGGAKSGALATQNRSFDPDLAPLDHGPLAPASEAEGLSMRYENTPGLTRALSRAAAWAAILGQEEILPESMLRGLLEDEEAQPSTLLVLAGVDRQE